jgi:hypothetical protein
VSLRTLQSLLKKVKKLLAADERRWTPIEKNWLIRVHRRSSAARNHVAGVFQQPLQQKTCLTSSLNEFRIEGTSSESSDLSKRQRRDP